MGERLTQTVAQALQLGVNAVGGKMGLHRRRKDVTEHLAQELALVVLDVALYGLLNGYGVVVEVVGDPCVLDLQRAVLEI